MLRHGPIGCNLDMDSPGARSGFLELTHSSNQFAFSVIQIPIAVIANGNGLTVLLTGGNHGDEDEGQLICRMLREAIAPEDISGRIIFMPALNMPAVLARQRVSPLDEGNMNRAFPGDSAGGPTKAIAAFVTNCLIPLAEVILDFHSGGTATRYLDCGFLCVGPNHELNKMNLALAEAFGAPHTVVLPIDGSDGDFDTAAHMAGVSFLSCELGGGATVTEASLQTGFHGALRVLHQAGLIKASLLQRLSCPERPHPTTFLDYGTQSHAVTVSEHALVRPIAQLGDDVNIGDSIAMLYDLFRTERSAQSVTAPFAGVVTVARRNPVVAPGDHLYLICQKIKREALLARLDRPNAVSWD